MVYQTAGQKGEQMQKASELEFLRYFYAAAGDCFGPAEDDVYDAIKQGFKKSSKKELPESYEEYECRARSKSGCSCEFITCTKCGASYRDGIHPGPCLDSIDMARLRSGDFQGPCPRCGKPIYELSGDSYSHVGCSRG